MLHALRRLWEHLAWADEQLLKALEAGPTPPGAALREYSHILGADETWLARLEGRTPTAPVWPQMELPELRRFSQELHSAYSRYLATLDDAQLLHEVAYTTTEGRPYSTPVQEILLHVALHAQYHRGKVNLHLRQAELVPAATDYIAYGRSVHA